MSFEKPGAGALDYELCRYGKSRIAFRGPRKRLDGSHIAFIGGTETFGKFVAEPFPELVEQALGLPCANFGWGNAGIDVFLNEPAVTDAARQAQVTVIQVMGAHNMSNRFYRVHPRRNDRFIGASQTMKMIFREVDFTEFNFTRHLIGRLAARAPDRFPLIWEELRAAWLARMQMLINVIESDVILLWAADRTPDQATSDPGPGRDPVFVDRLLIEQLRPMVRDIVEVEYSVKARDAGTEGMVFDELDRPAAERTPGPRAHVEMATALVPVIEDVMAKKRPTTGAGLS
ncbi:DUF6473 family protein [Shimia biformata]|uniref:DUF6473 family protein n=1 Tax=Shimia biformata TaxID=1294299 RepID=UPI0019523B4C|nr:DUF6473 family protein [Shimia biformata]